MREIAIAIGVAGALIALAIEHTGQSRVVAFAVNTGTRLIITDAWTSKAMTCVLYDGGPAPVRVRCEEVSTQ